MSIKIIVIEESETNLTAEALKEDEITQKVINERLFFLTKYHKSVSKFSRNFLFFWQANTQRTHMK